MTRALDPTRRKPHAGTDQMDAFMKDKIRIYTAGAQALGLGKQ